MRDRLTLPSLCCPNCNLRREVRAGGGEQQFSTALGEATAGVEQAVLTELLPRIAEE